MGAEKSNVAQRIPVDVALVVFGTDRAKKRHASRFPAALATKAQEAARAMGMRALRIVSDEQRRIAMKLPKGTVSPRGVVVVPLVQSALYDKLLSVAGPADAEKPPVPTAGSSPTEPRAATSGDAKPDPKTSGPSFVSGSIVLATEKEDEGWYPCVVQHVDGVLLTLRWRDWPDLPKFNRKITQVATLHPNAVKPC